MKRGLFVLLVIGMIFVVGCSQIDFGRFDPFGRGGDLGGGIRGGRQLSVGRGLTLTFVQNMPPRELKAVDGTTQSFRVGLSIVNFGEAQSGTLKIRDSKLTSAYGPNIVKVDESFTIEGAEYIYDPRTGRLTGSYPFGRDEPPLTFGPFSYTNIRGSDTTIITATLEIPSYSAEISPIICIPGRSGLNVCSIAGPVNLRGSDKKADTIPVSVTRINKNIAILEDGIELTLDIELKNLGGGEIEDGRISSFNVDLGGRGMRCFPTSEIRLDKSGRASVTCISTLLIDPDQSFVEFPLRISYSFPYKLTVNSGRIPITNVGVV